MGQSNIQGEAKVVGTVQPGEHRFKEGSCQCI